MIRILLGLLALLTLSLTACTENESYEARHMDAAHAWRDGGSDDEVQDRISRQAAYTPFVDIEKLDAEQSIASQPSFAVRTDKGHIPIDEEGTVWDGGVEITWPNPGEDDSPWIRLRLSSSPSGDEGYRELGYHKDWVSINEPAMLTNEFPFGMCRKELWWGRLAIERHGDERTVTLQLYLDLDRPHVIQSRLDPKMSFKVGAMRDQELFDAFSVHKPDGAGVATFLMCEQYTPKFIGGGGLGG